MPPARTQFALGFALFHRDTSRESLSHPRRCTSWRELRRQRRRMKRIESGRRGFQRRDRSRPSRFSARGSRQTVLCELLSSFRKWTWVLALESVAPEDSESLATGDDWAGWASPAGRRLARDVFRI